MLVAPGLFRPSRVLGLLLSGVAGVFIGFLAWQLSLSDGDRRLISKGDWVVVVSVVTAVVGWLVNAIVTVRNSVKQHTVNTLLESRHSELYMTRADAVSSALAMPGGNLKKITSAQATAGQPIGLIRNVQYFLNYFEFVAVGILYGDLDEALMKGSVRGFVQGLCHVADEVIKANGTEGKKLEHLRWLNTRWADSSRQSEYEYWKFVSAYALVGLALAAWTPASLHALTARTAQPVKKSEEIQGATTRPAPLATRINGRTEKPTQTKPAK